MDDPKPDAAKPAADPDPPQSRFGRLITKYPTFVSSFVIGVAGLAATSIWQYRQQQTQRSQAEATQKVAETQAANSWKIERTDVLAKNLETLAQSGPNTADQRYGVLLSLTRADIIDQELAVSYALELGKDNTDYMVSVLANTQGKDYARIARAYTLTCEERYGVAPPIDACNDKLAARSEALGQLVAQETDVALAQDQPGPLVLLKDERRVQLDVQQLDGLFETALLGMYDRRQWDELDKFSQFSTGAHLVSSLVLAAAHTGEFVTEDEAKALAQFHATQTKWLTDYLMSKSCDAECKGRIIDVIVSHFEEAQGDFDAALRKLLESSRSQSGIAISRMHARLLWCQVDDTDLAPLRGRVLVPSAIEMIKSPNTDPSTRDAVISLLAVVPEPRPPDAEWTELLATLDKNPVLGKTFRDRRAIAARQRQGPPTTMRKVSFCNASTVPAATPTAAITPAATPVPTPPAITPAQPKTPPSPSRR